MIKRIYHAFLCYRAGRQEAPGRVRNCHYSDAVRCLTGEAFA